MEQGIQEESDVLAANSLEWKQVAKQVSNITRMYFFNKLEQV